MDMPWYGWVVSLFMSHLFIYVSGRNSGKAEAVQMLLASQAKAMQMPNLPGMPPGAGGR